MSRILFAIFLSAFLSLHATADSDDCSDQRLDEGNGAVAKIPVYSQEDKNICYAVVATEMADAYRISHGGDASHLSSVMATAAFYSGKFRAQINAMPGIEANDNIELGNIGGAIQVLREKGSCHADALFGGKMEEYSNQLKLMRDLQKKYRSAGGDPNLAIQKICPDFQKIASGSIDMNQELLAQAFSEDKFYSYLDKLLSVACANSSDSLKDLPPLSGVSGLAKLSKNDRQKSFADTVSEAFQQNPAQPLILNFCHQTMLNADTDFHSPAGRGCTLHSTMIVGRRKRGSSCQVLIRETEGANCNADYHWPCEAPPHEGEYWVPLEKAADRSYDLLYFKDPTPK